MDYFDDDEQNTNTKANNQTFTIEMWVEVNGRKKNTYVSGWTLPEAELKEHSKTIKKKNGCNGTIKTIPNEAGNGFITVLQFQGDHSDYIKEYLTKNGVDEDSINIKG